MRVTAVLLVWCCLVGPSVAVAAADWVPFRLVGGRPAIPVQMGQVAGWATFDSAASYTLVSREAAAAAGRTFRRASEQMDQDWQFRTPTRMHLPHARATLLGVEVELGPATVLEAPAAGELLRLGMPFLSLFVLQVDYPGQRLRFLVPDTVSVPDTPGLEVRQDWWLGSTILTASLGGEEDVRLGVATAYPGGVLMDRRAAERRGWDLPGQDGAAAAMPLVLGGYALSDVPVAASRVGDSRGRAIGGSRGGHSAPSSIDRIDGLLGHEVLRHFVVTLDLRRGRVHLALPDDS